MLNPHRSEVVGDDYDPHRTVEADVELMRRRLAALVDMELLPDAWHYTVEHYPGADRPDGVRIVARCPRGASDVVETWDPAGLVLNPEAAHIQAVIIETVLAFNRQVFVDGELVAIKFSHDATVAWTNGGDDE